MKSSFLSIIILIFLSSFNFPQKRPLDMAIIGEPVKDFTLPVYQGGEFNLSHNKGKNVLIVFPRGYYDKDIWCDICTYEYLDLVDEFYNKKLAEKYNLDVVVVLPYDSTTISKWLTDLPEVYDSFEKSKHPTDTTNERAMTWERFSNKHYPKIFNINEGETPLPFKILIDGDHKFSERLEIFKNEWWGTKVEQNMPTFILLDKNNTVVFKYIAQHTIDRPGTDYLKKIMDSFL